MVGAAGTRPVGQTGHHLPGGTCPDLGAKLHGHGQGFFVAEEPLVCLGVGSVLDQIRAEGPGGCERPSDRPHSPLATEIRKEARAEAAPQLVREADRPGQPGTTSGNVASDSLGQSDDRSIAVSACGGKRKQPLTTGVNGCLEERERGFEPPTSSLGSSLHSDVSVASKGLATGPFSGCPRICPSELSWMHDGETSISPATTINVMLEEFLQSADVSRALRLSIVLAEEDRVVRLDSLAMPNGFAYAQTRDVVA